MRSLQANSAHLELASLFDALAPALIQLDITPTSLAQIARVAFVRACAKQVRVKSSGRPHLAKIAALTGLSRAEVKRLISEDQRFVELGADSGPRALRV